MGAGQFIQPALTKSLTKYSRYAGFSRTDVSTDTIKSQIPFRASSIATLEDFSNPTGWSGEADTIGAAVARSITSTGTQVQMQKIYATPIAFKPYILVDIWVDDVTKLSSCLLYLFTAGYTDHFLIGISSRPLKNGLNTLVLNQQEFSVGQGTPSWDNITIMRFAATATAGQTVTMKVANIRTYEMPPLVSIWFDDGQLTQYSVGYTKMQAASPPLPGVLSVIGNATAITNAEYRTMMANGWEMVNHTHGHKSLTELTLAEVEYQISRGLEKCLAMGAGRGAYHFVVPQGNRNANIDQIIKKYAISSRYGAGNNYLPILDPYSLKCREVNYNVTTATIQGWIDDAILYNTWLILLFHALIDPADSSGEYTPTDFQTVIDYIATQVTAGTIKCVTVSEALCY